MHTWEFQNCSSCADYEARSISLAYVKSIPAVFEKKVNREEYSLHLLIDSLFFYA